MKIVKTNAEIKFWKIKINWFRHFTTHVAFQEGVHIDLSRWSFIPQHAQVTCSQSSLLLTPTDARFSRSGDVVLCLAAELWYSTTKQMRCPEQNFTGSSNYQNNPSWIKILPKSHQNWNHISIRAEIMNYIFEHDEFSTIPTRTLADLGQLLIETSTRQNGTTILPNP